VAGFSAYSRIIDWKIFRDIADSIGAYFMVDMAHIAGLVATGFYPSPIPFADVVTSTTHKTLRGPRGGLILAKENHDITKKINSAVFPGQQGGPLMHVIAAKAVAFHEALQPSFKIYQEQIIKNAKAMAQILLDESFDLVSGGTDNHLLLMKLLKQNISGKEVEQLLGLANITVNKNSIPNDPASFMVTSGIRIGTAAVTTRGLKEKECQQIAHWIAQLIKAPHNEALRHDIKQQVVAMLEGFPVP
jgi:glycine hydroxymethyltransferase